MIASKTIVAHGGFLSAEELPEVVRNWKAGNEAKDIEGIVALYHPHIVFKGTVWNEVVRTRDDMVRYFTNFVKGRTEPKVHFLTLHSFELGCDAVVYAGEYEFCWYDDMAQEHTLAANYTFVTQNGLITVHHSSKREA
jgi:hypothetical protein